MNKAEIIRRAALAAGITQGQALNVLNEFRDIVKEVVVGNNEPLTLPGIATLKPGERAAREGRNPHTGEKLHLPAKRVVKVTLDKGLRDML